MVEGATKSSCPTDQEEAMPLSRGGPENSAELPGLQFGNFSVKQEPIEPDVITRYMTEENEKEPWSWVQWNKVGTRWKMGTLEDKKNVS